MGIKIKKFCKKNKMKIQLLLLPAVLGSWWNPKTWVSTVVNTITETVKPVASVKSDSYAHTRLDSTSEILNTIGLDNVWLKYDVNSSPKTRHAIKWTQHNRCMVSCIENYREYYYYEEHDEKQLPIRVFVAEEYVTNGAPPTWIHTQNAHQRLYMAYFPIDYAKPKEDHAAIFVYQPSENEDDREIYQKLFIGGYGATHFTNNYTGDFLRYV